MGKILIGVIIGFTLAYAIGYYQMKRLQDK